MDPRIDPTLFNAAFPNEVVGGEPLIARRTFSEQGKDIQIIAWTGVTLSSFGIVYNNDSLKQLGLDQPTTWNDLADPKLRGWVALADPGHSGSISKTFETILRREGWTQGWMTLRMVFANARYFATSSDRVPVDVSRGDAAAGMCIDFYGRYQAGAVGKNRMGYADPVEAGRSMTATTADPITLLRGAPSTDLARDFIGWLLTPEAQSLWQRAKADKDDGLVRPDKFELRRQPIRADLYTPENQASWVDQELDPYLTAVPFPEGTPTSYFAMVAPVTKAMAIDTHEDLVLAWDAIVDSVEHRHPNRIEMILLFHQMPKELTLDWPDVELSEHWQVIQAHPNHPRHSEVLSILKAFEDQLNAIDNLDAKRVRWRAFFRDNYREVVRLGNE